MTEIEFTAGSIKLSQVINVIKHKSSLRLSSESKKAVLQSREVIDELISQQKTIYGVNTGFGKLAHKVISEDKLIELQHNLLRSHAVGTGPVLQEPIVQLMLFMKLNGLAQGYSGIRWEVIEYLQSLYNSELTPIIPAKGSVGASGDLAPLAHMSLILIGEGEAHYQGEIINGRQALELLNLQPLVLQPKEGLALVNGTQASTAILAYALYLTQVVFNAALLSGGLTLCATMSSTKPFDPRIHSIRGLAEQQQVAHVILELVNEAFTQPMPEQRVQDPYSIRCQPQVMGSCLNAMRHVATILEQEINAVTDNPLVFAETKEVISGGNFHAEPIAFAADQLACVIAEIGNLSERRINLLCDANLSGLPDFLMKDNGLNSGFMMPHVTAAALCSENKIYAHPAVVDNIPTSGNQEDHVSMATTAAFRLLVMIENVADVISIELLAACQGIDLQDPQLRKGVLQKNYERVRAVASFCEQDRFFASDMKAIKQLLYEEKFELSASLRSNVDVFI